MTGLFSGFILLYLIKFTGAPWWLYLILVPAIITDICRVCYAIGKDARDGEYDK